MAKPSKARKRLQKELAAAQADVKRLGDLGADDDAVFFALGVAHGLNIALDVVE